MDKKIILHITLSSNHHKKEEEEEEKSSTEGDRASSTVRRWGEGRREDWECESERKRA